MRKTTIILALICLIIAFTGCENLSNRDYYSNVDQYEEIWELTEFNHMYNEEGDLFPESISDLDVVEFFCIRDENILSFSVDYQIFLQINYQDTSVFKNEVSRIKKYALACDDAFSLPDFSCFSTNLGENLWYEYALVDTATQNIYYVYLQDVAETELKMDSRFLPKNYSLSDPFVVGEFESDET